MEEFLSQIQNAIDSKALFKITFSKPKEKKGQLRNIFLRPIELGGEIKWKAVLRYQTNDQTQVYPTDSLVETIKSHLENTFQNVDLLLADKKITLLQSKKGKINVLVKSEKHVIEIEPHDHQKKRLIPESTPFLRDLGVSSQNGKVFGHAQDKYKQINRYVELLSQLIKNDESIQNVYDMGSGKGYLTFALHNYLFKKSTLQVQTTGIELRADLVEKCNSIAHKNQLEGLSFELGSIDSYSIPKADLVIALHACDIATDMAIAKGLEANAKYIVVAPCCHKQIRKAMQKTNTSMNPLLHHGILKERMAEMVTDTIRALILESKGYEVKVFEFISSEHTGKNIMLTAKKTSIPKDIAIEKIQSLKAEFGIQTHYLEKLVEL
ncbi:MAG: SAM-dependent methyltransferase [Saprospiraceae bacterium]|nr:SAM-dependent methyltransferase [Saprospiraceae bacterium]